MIHARLVLAAALAACSSAPGPATLPPPPKVAPVSLDGAALTSYVESIGRDWGEARRFSGFVLVAQGDRLLYEHGFGYANRETHAVATADTSFRIGSTTKQFTATAILLLEGEGKLSTSDPISKHLPSYPEPGRSITIHQLLTHTSGIPNYTGLPSFEAERGKPHTVAQLVALTAGKPLDFAPGTNWAYSNSNYVLLGAIIEAVAKQPYATFLASRVFQPAGLARTVVGDAEGMPDRALGYEPDGDKLVAAFPVDMSVPFAAGAVRSTARDLWRWHRVLGTDLVLPRAARDKLYRPDKQDYAYGWRVREVEGRHIVEHGGGIDGFATAYIRDPAADLVIVAWANNMYINAEQVARAALALSFGRTPKPLDEGKPGEIAPELAKQLAGTYKLTPAARQALADKGLPEKVLTSVETVEITPHAKSLGFKPNGQREVEITPTADGAFVAPELGVRVTFTVDPKSGAPASGLRLAQGGLEIDYAR